MCGGRTFHIHILLRTIGVALLLGKLSSSVASMSAESNAETLETGAGKQRSQSTYNQGTVISVTNRVTTGNLSWR